MDAQGALQIERRTYRINFGDIQSFPDGEAQVFLLRGILYEVNTVMKEGNSYK